MTPRRPPGCSSGPVLAWSARLLVRSCLCVVCALASLALSLYRPRPCSPCIIPVWSAILLGLVLACTAGFDGSPPCSTGPHQARSSILLASSCPRTVCALARPFLCRPCSGLPCSRTVRPASCLVPPPFGPPDLTFGPVHARSAILLASPRPRTVRAIACLLSLSDPPSCLLCLVPVPSTLLPALSFPCTVRP